MAGALIVALCLIAIASDASAHDAIAQARNPFSVGISEGGGQATGVTGWILAQQAAFEKLLSGAVRAIKADGAALWTLLGISFAYGVFHAAGPGHGKAVVASYMLANERALKRGIAISGLAAVLQALVAIIIVGVLALLLNATAQSMRQTANLVELASYGGIALLGLWLVWRKGKALYAALRTTLTAGAHAGDVELHRAHAAEHGHHHETHDHHAHASAQHDHKHAHEHVHDEHCGHFHAPDPRTLGEGFSWGGAIATVFAAGLRPCSGAILVLVFALAQGIFWAGVLAAFAMAAGTALTTGALAALAVLAKSVALKVSGEDSPRAALFVRLMEFGAACLVLLVGASLFAGASLTWTGA